MQKSRGTSTQTYIIAARTAQGYDDWNNSTPEERLDVVNNWDAIQSEHGEGTDYRRRGSLKPPEYTPLEGSQLSLTERGTLDTAETADSQETQEFKPIQPHEIKPELPARGLQYLE